MTKTEIIQRLATENDCTQKLAGSILDSFIDLIGDELRDGNAVSIMGFGKFSASLVKGREGKNPQDPSQTMMIPDSYRVYFSSGARLKDKVNEKLRKPATKKATATKKKKKK